MIKDPDLNDLRKALAAYFEYDPEGPKTLKLNQTTALKLLDLLNNLEEINVDEAIPYSMADYFPNDDFASFVRNNSAKKIAFKLINDHYVTFSQTDDLDPLGTRFRASAVVLKRGGME